MHYSPILATLAVAMSVDVLAFPTYGNHTSILEKRGKGSIGAFDNWQCTGHPVGRHPKDNRDCISYTPETDIIGIDWGNNFFLGRAAKVRVFKQDHCKGQEFEDIMSPGWDDSKGTDMCISMKAHGGPWKSVQFYAEA